MVSIIKLRRAEWQWLKGGGQLEVAQGRTELASDESIVLNFG